MTDRELLELAAKAIGTVYVDGASWDEGAGWNPLADDGDALRLAVKLMIPLQFPDWADAARTWGPKDAEEPCDEQFDGDPYAATRRAIVRAAAHIGENMK